MRYVVIMAGGAGTRLWPLSRKGTPKQLLRLIDGRSLLRISYERVAGLVPDDRILVCAGAAYLDDVAAELPELPRTNLLGEPVGRDSLNAVAWPAAVIAGREPEAVMAVLTADHVISPVSEFRSALEEAFQACESDAGALVTFGVVPTEPNTGFGYLERGDAVPGTANTFSVRSFREKPDRSTAQGYVESGRYWWNSGMFVWRAETLLEQLRLLAPETHAGALSVAADPSRLVEVYPNLPRNSVDFAVMEPVSQGRGSAHVLAVRLNLEWHDIGGFAALAGQLEHDPQGNAVEGLAVGLDSSNNLIINRGGDRHLVAVVGLSETVVVRTPDITLVSPLAASEDIKRLVAKVQEKLGGEFA